MATKVKRKRYRYAEGTDVLVAKSQEEVRKLVVDKMGAQKYGTMADRAREFVIFELAGVPHSIKVLPYDTEAEHRRVWRCVVLLVKALWTLVESEMLTVEQALLPTVALPGGQSLAEALTGQVRGALQQGIMPQLFPALTNEKSEARRHD